MEDQEHRDDNGFIKKTFFAHLKRMGFTDEHLEVYDEYFDFFLDHLGGESLMEMEPERAYQAALASIEELDGEDVVEAFLELMEYFMGFWAERWELVHPQKDTEETPDKNGEENDETGDNG
ncbi:MAG: hypothetical protein R6V10_00470 [bacterium]